MLMPSLRRGLAWGVTAALAAFAPVILGPASEAATPTDLFFSEYVEGSSNNKALEIFNGTGSTLDLAGYDLQFFFNGSATAGATIPLVGSVRAGDVHVVAQASAHASILAQADQTSAQGWFNGDDAVVLRRGPTVLDVIGQIGVDPGTQWGAGLTGTADKTLRRMASVCVGDGDGSNVFDPAAQWEGFAGDTFSMLGAHTADCGSAPTDDTAPSVAAITPADGSAGADPLTSPTVAFSEPVTLGAGALALSCGGNQVLATVTGGPTTYTLTPTGAQPAGTTCTITVVAAAVSDTDANDPPDAMAADVTSSYAIAGATHVCQADSTPIGTVQGSGPSTPLSGQTVTIEGVVVADYEGPSPALRGFFLQAPVGDNDPATSDGIFVFNGSNQDSVSLGDLVRVTGTASENQQQTQVSVTPANIVPCGTAAIIATEVTLPLATASDLERVEGMLVHLPQTLSVTEHFQLGRFGQVVVSSGGRLPQPTEVVAPGPDAVALQAANNLNRLIVDDGSQTQNPDPIVFGRGGLPLTAPNTLRGGDTLTGATGVLMYGWGGNSASPNAYRLRPQVPTGTFDFVAANARPSAPPAVGGTVQVAGVNLLNWFNTFGTNACRGGVNGPPMDCRGADNATEFERQAAKTVTALVTLDADVVAVNETENDGYGPASAMADLVDRLNAATAAGTWAYVDVDAGTGRTDALGTDAIKVGMLYKPAVVSPVGRTSVLNTPAFVNGGDAVERNRPSLAQALQVSATGAVFIVNVNHLKSKGSACETPDLGQGEGNCSVVRNNAARELTQWLATDPTGTGDPDVVLVGDYNSYALETPISTLEEAGYTNLVTSRLGEGTYSYAFDGQWGHLDHALATPSLLPQVTGVGEHHINADEPSVLDYNTNFKTTNQQNVLYAPDEFRVSDHDPVLVGLTPNAAPRVSAGGPYTVDEGGSITLHASGSDANGDPVSYAWDLEGDGTFDTSGQDATFSAATLDGPSTATVAVQVSDPLGLTAVASATVVVRNVAPSATAAFGNGLLTCDAAVGSLTVSLTDPGVADTQSVDIDWGDGSHQLVPGAASALTLTHTYEHSGAYIVSVHVTDDDGGVGTTAASVALAYATTGFLPPLRPGTSQFNSRSSIPVKIGFSDCTGAAAPDIDPVGVVTLDGRTVATSALRLSTAGEWQWNLRASSLPDPTGTYTLTVTVAQTGQTVTTTFRLR